jgi:hypothetical protein
VTGREGVMRANPENCDRLLLELEDQLELDGAASGFLLNLAGP